MPDTGIRSVRCIWILLSLSCTRSDVNAVLQSSVAMALSDYDGPNQPGACVLARHNGALLYERCFGIADFETQQHATPETNFRLASVTKQFTATAVLRLVQDGAFGTGTALTQILQEFPSYGDAITVHHLLTHTSGLMAYENVLPSGDESQITDSGVLALMEAQDSTYFVPGSAFRYSNSGYAVLSQIVERVSGVGFGEYLQQHVFAPVGMAGTVAHVAGVTTVPNRAYGYSRGQDGSWERTDQSRTSAVLGDGGIYSSIRDLNRWLAVVEGRSSVLAPELARLLFEETFLTDGTTAGYGYGWFIDEYRDRRRFRHDGTTIGFRNEIRVFPDDQLSVVLLTNRNEIGESLKDAISDVFLDNLDDSR